MKKSDIWIQETERDELFEDAARHLINQIEAASDEVKVDGYDGLQRKFKLGYFRATRIALQLEEAGILGKRKPNGRFEIGVRTISELEILLTET